MTQGFAEEKGSLGGVSAGGEKEVNGIAAAIDSAVEVGSLSANFDIGLIDVSTATEASAAERASVLRSLWAVCLYPPVEGGVVDVDSSFVELFFHVAVTNAVVAVPAYVPQVDVLGKCLSE